MILHWPIPEVKQGIERTYRVKRIPLELPALLEILKKFCSFNVYINLLHPRTLESFRSKKGESLEIFQDFRSINPLISAPLLIIQGNPISSTHTHHFFLKYMFFSTIMITRKVKINLKDIEQSPDYKFFIYGGKLIC